MYSYNWLGTRIDLLHEAAVWVQKIRSRVKQNCQFKTVLLYTFTAKTLLELFTAKRHSTVSDLNHFFFEIEKFCKMNIASVYIAE